MTIPKILLIAAAASAVSLFGTKPSAAYDYPFCSKGEAGPGDCRYSTLEQCQEAVSGISSYCQPNFWLPQTPQHPQPVPRRRARRS